MNADGTNEIIAPSIDENIYCIDPRDFSVKWEYDTGNENQTALTFCDITGDGTPEVFGVSDYDLRLSIIDGTKGQQIGEFDLKKEHSKFNQTHALVADIDMATDIITGSSWHAKIRVGFASNCGRSKR
jgi:outer membrane protein assembly factor BamB